LTEIEGFQTEERKRRCIHQHGRRCKYPKGPSGDNSSEKEAAKGRRKKGPGRTWRL